jgi:hypothetical protein
MAETRAFLIKRGMNVELADTLARRYINRAEAQGSIHSVMDFFDSGKNASALTALLKAPLSQVNFSYQVWSEYTQDIASRQVQTALNLRGLKTPPFSTFHAPQPVRPLGGARGFSAKVDKSEAMDKLKYTEEYLERQAEQNSAKKGKFFEFIKKIDKLDAMPSAPTGAKGTEAATDYDLSELDISFEKISRP